PDADTEAQAPPRRRALRRRDRGNEPWRRLTGLVSILRVPLGREGPAGSLPLKARGSRTLPTEAPLECGNEPSKSCRVPSLPEAADRVGGAGRGDIRGVVPALAD